MKFVIFFSILLLPILLFPYFYKVENLECVSQYGECSPETLAGLANFENHPVKSSLLNLEKYLSENSRIRSHKIIYRPLADITIEIVEEKADIAVKENNSQEFLLITRDGKVITVAQETTLPKLFIVNDSIKHDDPEAKFSKDLLIELAKYYDINEVFLDESSITGAYKSELKLTFPVEGDIDIILGSLELLLFQLKQSLPDTKISSIDLRYKNPVVK